MTRKKSDDSIEVMVARIDERVEHLHQTLPMVRRHDKELLVGKVLLAVGFVALAAKFPMIAEALGKVLN